MKIKKLTEEEKVNEPEIVEITPEDSTKEAEEKINQITDTDVSNKQVDDWQPIDSGRQLKAGRTEVYSKVSLKVENRITEALDDSLSTALNNLEKHHTNTRANIRIVGLPGSGKTASVYDWAARKTGGDKEYKIIDGKWYSRPIKDEKYKKINMVYVNMKNNDLQAWIDGYSMYEKGDNDEKGHVKQAYSSNLDILDIPNSVLFLDEYSRQKDEQIRASVLTLINEHYISGEDKGRRYFPNFLFTVACENPAIIGDTGAARPNGAEKTRFYNTVQGLDSDPQDTIEYLEKEWIGGIKQELSYEEPDLDLIEEYARILDLGKFLISDSRFKYDDAKNAAEIMRTSYPYEAKECNQRDICTALENTKGDVEKLKNWVRKFSNYLTNVDYETGEEKGQKKTRDIILEILDDYLVPTREELFKDLQKYDGEDGFDFKELLKGIENTEVEEPKAEEPVEPEVEVKEPEVEIEDDPDAQDTIDSSKMYGGAKTVGAGQVSPNDAKDRINKMAGKFGLID